MIHILWASLAIPVVIHLVHRRKARRVLFSTLRFLHMVDQRVARRQRLKELLLLAARLLLLAAVVGALYHRTVGLLAGGRARTAVAIVMDDTYSLRATEDGTTRFERAREAVRHVLDGLHPGDVACIVPAHNPPDAAADLTAALDWLRGELDDSSCTYGADDLGRALRLACGALMESDAERKELYIVTDMQAQAWPSADGMPDLPEGAEVFLVDVGGSPTDNLALSRAEFGLRVQVAGLASELYCTLTNTGTEALERDVEFFVGKDRVARKTVKVPANAERDVMFSHIFPQPGLAGAAVRLAADSVDADNARFTAANVREVPVLVVNGRESAVSYLSETYYLEHALMVGPGRQGMAGPLRVTVAAPEALATEELSAYDCIVLANVRDVARPEELREYVSAGGGLVVFVGDQVDPATYNNVLGTGEAGLLPAPLGAARDRSENPENAPFEGLNLDARHPVFRPLIDQISTGSVRISRFLSVGAEHNATVLAEVAGEPLVLEGTFGEGSVVLCVTAADMDWSNLPMRASFYVPAIHQMVYHVARNVDSAPNVQVGADLRVPEELGTVMNWYGPSQEPGGDPVLIERSETDADANLLASVTQPGVYRAVLAAGGRDRERLFAVNVDPRESNPERVDDAEALEWLGGDRAVLVRDTDRLAGLAVRRREGLPLWDYLLVLALAVAVFETFLANVWLKR